MKERNKYMKKTDKKDDRKIAVDSSKMHNIRSFCGFNYKKNKHYIKNPMRRK